LSYNLPALPLAETYFGRFVIFFASLRYVQLPTLGSYARNVNYKSLVS